MSCTPVCVPISPRVRVYLRTRLVEWNVFNFPSPRPSRRSLFPPLLLPMQSGNFGTVKRCLSNEKDFHSSRGGPLSTSVQELDGLSLADEEGRLYNETYGSEHSRDDGDRYHGLLSAGGVQSLRARLSLSLRTDLGMFRFNRIRSACPHDNRGTVFHYRHCLSLVRALYLALLFLCVYVWVCERFYATIRMAVGLLSAVK